MSMYAGAVRKVVAPLLLLIAVLLMPFGMAPSAASEAHHAMTAAMPTKHCPEQVPNHESKGALAQCTMACAAAVPASSSPVEEPCRMAAEVAVPGPGRLLAGLHPETATPPPKRS